MLLKRQIKYLDFLIDATFQGVNRLFVLSFETEAQKISCKRYYLLTAKIKKLQCYD